MQQINLLNPALIKKSDFINPNNIALLLGTLLLALFGYFYIESNALATLEKTKLQLASQLSTSEKQMAEIRVINQSKNDQTTLLNTIKTLEQKVNMQKEMLKAIGQSDVHQAQSYAAILKAFANQSIDGLWMTGLSIDRDTEMLSIKGRTFNADLLPTFIANLRTEPALKGKTFTDLTMQSIVASAVQSTTPSTAQAGNSPATSTSSSVDIAKITQPATPAYIEFTLRSVLDNKNTAQQKVSANTPEIHPDMALANSGGVH